MKLFARNQGKKTRGQTMVEFALVLPLLLVTMYGIMELGRLLFIYVTTTSASREAARYASGTELVERNGVLVERFRDCAGIREAAQRVGLIAGIDQILIRYDSGPGTTLSENCTTDIWPNQRALNDRVVVSVRGNFRTIVPMVPLGDQAILSETARTIIRNVEVDVDFQPPPAMSDEQTPPFVSFALYTRWIYEDHGVYVVQVRLTDEDGDYYPVPTGETYVIPFSVSGEAEDGSDYSISGSYEAVFNEGISSVNININIIDDLIYEYLERIVLHLQQNDYANRIHPYAHVIYILNDDPPPLVAFFEEQSQWVEYNPDHPGIPVILDGETVVPASVGFTVSGTAQEGVDYIINLPYNSDTGQYRLYFDGPPIPDSQSIVITPLEDVEELEGPETIVLTLTDPVNAILGGITTHTLTLIDTQCNVYGENPALVGNQVFSWGLVNDGSLAASLSQITASYTEASNTVFQDVRLAGSNLWSGAVNQIPFTVPSSPGAWILGGDFTLPVGSSKTLELGFRDPVITSIDSVNITFDNGCPPISITNILPPP